MFSKACEYAILATIFIAEKSCHDRKVSLKDIANAIESPEAYTSKILQQLSRINIIYSSKGPNGGFSMDRKKMTEVKLSTIVSAIDGDNIYIGCGLGFKQCNEHLPCPVHNKFSAIRNDLKIMLETTTVKSLTMDVSNGLTFLKR